MVYNWLAHCSADVMWRATKIALVVGSILNLINQGEALLDSGKLSIPHLLLNYCVPFAVSAYSALQTRASAKRQNT